MKNIQVIDGAENCSYSICLADEEDFELIFPTAGQDVEFIEDYAKRVGKDHLKERGPVYRSTTRRIHKQNAMGIHGTLFFEFPQRRNDFPNRRESDADNRPYFSPSAEVKVAKNIQVIDDSPRCTFPIFLIDAQDFNLIFPNSGQDVEFIEDLARRIGETRARELLSKGTTRRICKKDVTGIHGTLFVGFPERRKYFPNKRDDDIDMPPFYIQDSSRKL